MPSRQTLRVHTRAPRRISAGTPQRRNGQRGFTLLEVLIAVSITAIIGVGVWQLLSSVISAKQGIDRVSDEFSRMQQAVVMLERDLAQMVLRPVRDPYGETIAAVTSRQEPWFITFTRAGWRNPLQAARSDLQRVAYEVLEEDQELVRHYWDVLDQAQDTVPREQVLLEDVLDLTWRFLDEDREWHDDWPTDAQVQSMPTGGGAQVQLPLAVEFTLDHRRFGRVRRLIDLGDFSPEEFQRTRAVLDAGEQEDDDDQSQSGEEDQDSRSTGNSNVNPEAGGSSGGGQ